MRAAIYARYSTARQDELSIVAQIRACSEYAAANHYTVVRSYADEAISGKGKNTQDRKQYQAMLRDAQKGMFDILLIHKYDRVARNVGEHVNLDMRLNQHGVSIIAVAQDFGNSKESKIIKTLMWSLSEYYIDNLAEETKKGLKEKALLAMHNGGVAPFGYDVVDRKYVINDLEAAYVRKIFTAALEMQGFSQIIQEMSACGIKGKRGKTIRYPQIYEMLRNEKYSGVYLYTPDQDKERADRRAKPNAIRIEDALPAIVSKEEYEEVQQIMNKRKHTGKKNDYLCSGLVYCECGAKMHAASPTRKGHTYRKYFCSAKCGAGSISVIDVDYAATSYLRELLSDKNQKLIADALQQYAKAESNRVEEYNTTVKKQIQQKQEKINALYQNLSSGALPVEVVAEMGNMIKTLKDEVAAISSAEPPVDYTVPQIKQWLKALKESADQKAIQMLIERIDIKTKTVTNVTSTLATVLGKHGCGGRT